ncbi:MAG: AI-2E family transporter [Bacteroidales bacterium]|nr:AI-2E family transporter [Bacteroidales bacterium]
MIDKELKLPLYAKAIFLIIGLCAFLTISYVAKGIIIPLVFAVILAIVLHPVVDFFVRRKINRVLAIVISLILTIIIIVAFGTLIYSQVNRFGESLPQLIDKFMEIVNNTITWASGYFDISARKINSWITDTEGEFVKNSGPAIGQTIVNVGSVLILLFLIPVYIFMILFYEPLLLEFFRRLFGAGNRNEVNEVIVQIKTLIQKYLTGLLIETLIIAVLYSIGLLILGIEYAIVLGIMGAFLNLIPYIGSWIAASLPMMIAIVTKTSPWFALLVLALYVIIQFIDNNFIVPKIVASKVKINALISIIAVIAFGSMWGIPGMLIAIPLTAIIKLIFDHIESLKPVGFLMGDTMPALALFKIKLSKK